MNEESDGSATDWQQVPKVKAVKRKQQNSPNKYQHKKQNISNNNEPSTSSNMFAELETNEVDLAEEPQSTPKPPPIFIPDVTDVNKMITNLTKVIPKSEISYKSLRNQVMLRISSVDSYRKLVKSLDNSNISYNTFQIRQERAFRIVMKGIHPSTPDTDIKSELLVLGHQVRSIINVKSRVNKERLPMFFIDLDPKSNNKDIYNVKYICNALVKIEPPRKTNELVQCYRCQLFGHTKSYCKRPFRCVKCGLGHSTAECTKDKNTPPVCVHCLQNHTANYRGCRVYKHLIQKRNYNNGFRQQHQNPNFSFSPQDYPHLPNNQNFNSQNDANFNKQSYSAVAQANNINHVDNNNTNLMAKMDKLIGMMSILINKLCN